MDSLLNILRPETLPIDFVMIILVLLGGLFQKRYMTDIKGSGAIKTLIVSTLFCCMYILIKIINGSSKDDDATRWFFSYVLATSMYELLMKKFVNKLFPDEKIDDDVKP